MKTNLRVTVALALAFIVTTASAGPFTTGLEKSAKVTTSLSIAK